MGAIMNQQYSLGLDAMPLNPYSWDNDDIVEVTHSEMLMNNLRLLRDSKIGGEQYESILAWIDAPITDVNKPFTFATCCKVIGIEDPDYLRSKLKAELGIE